MRKTKSCPGEVCAGLKVSPHFALLGFMFTARSVPSAEASAASEKLPLSVEDVSQQRGETWGDHGPRASTTSVSKMVGVGARGSKHLLRIWLEP